MYEVEGRCVAIGDEYEDDERVEHLVERDNLLMGCIRSLYKLRTGKGMKRKVRGVGTRREKVRRWTRWQMPKPFWRL